MDCWGGEMGFEFGGVSLPLNLAIGRYARFLVAEQGQDTNLDIYLLAWPSVMRLVAQQFTRIYSLEVICRKIPP